MSELPSIFNYSKLPSSFEIYSKRYLNLISYNLEFMQGYHDEIKLITNNVPITDFCGTFYGGGNISFKKNDAIITSIDIPPLPDNMSSDDIINHILRFPDASIHVQTNTGALFITFVDRVKIKTDKVKMTKKLYTEIMEDLKFVHDLFWKTRKKEFDFKLSFSCSDVYTITIKDVAYELPYAIDWNLFLRYILFPLKEEFYVVMTAYNDWIDTFRACRRISPAEKRNK